MNTIEHEIYDYKRWKKKVLLKMLRKKGMRKRFFNSDFFFDQILSESTIEKVELASMLKTPPSLHFENFLSRNGNLSPYELMCICALVAERRPKRLLEIGTFDGNTTLQMAINSPEDAVIHTIDLPPNTEATGMPILESDLQFIRDEKKQRRKFQGTRWEGKIRQHLGDSTRYDFKRFTEEGPLDCIFIDGGHSYQSVRSDTENALKVVEENGIILWHDFTPHFGGIFSYLRELSKQLPLKHIEGTNLVILYD